MEDVENRIGEIGEDGSDSGWTAGKGVEYQFRWVGAGGGWIKRNKWFWVRLRNGLDPSRLLSELRVSIRTKVGYQVLMGLETEALTNQGNEGCEGSATNLIVFGISGI